MNRIETIINIALDITRGKYPIAYNYIKNDITKICDLIITETIERAECLPKAKELTIDQINKEIANYLIWSLLTLEIEHIKRVNNK